MWTSRAFWISIIKIELLPKDTVSIRKKNPERNSAYIIALWAMRAVNESDIYIYIYMVLQVSVSVLTKKKLFTFSHFFVVFIHPHTQTKAEEKRKKNRSNFIQSIRITGSNYTIFRAPFKFHWNWPNKCNAIITFTCSNSRQHHQQQSQDDPHFISIIFSISTYEFIQIMQS